MSHAIVFWLPVVAFFGAGLFNAVGMRATQDDFARWGYPRWWCRVTGGLEIVTAALIALPVTRGVGLILGAAIIAAALSTVLRRREYVHLAPLSLFVALLVLAETVS